MSLSIHPAKAVPADAQEHGLSMHPKVRAVLAKGWSHEWTPKELAELLGVDVRTTQVMLEQGTIKSSAYPSATGGGKMWRRALGASVLLYLTEHSTEFNEADATAVAKTVLPMLSTPLLEKVIRSAQALIQKRSGLPMLVKASPKASNVIDAHAEFSFVSELQPTAQAQA